MAVQHEPHRSISANGRAVVARIPASIEVSPKQAIQSSDLPSLFPAGTRVYITDIAPVDCGDLVDAACRVRELGYEPVPHFAARRIADRETLANRLAALSAEAGVSDALVIGGGPRKPEGIYHATLDLLETGLFDRYGIKDIAVAGHPESSPDFSDAEALELLKFKQAFGERTGADMRIVTQFGFDAQLFIRWAEGLKACEIDIPVHLGVAGPAKLPTLIRYAAACGVGNSLEFLTKQAGKLTSLVSGFVPDTVVAPVERHWRDDPDCPIRQIHVFAFGGLKSASAWLRERGSW
ncbi:methylenetetrahydrofolate reductase [Croceicoccus mobilis]|nr:methylenetetrahydrofolate reductase [Croceicoccus mobilis]